MGQLWLRARRGPAQAPTREWELVLQAWPSGLPWITHPLLHWHQPPCSPSHCPRLAGPGLSGAAPNPIASPATLCPLPCLPHPLASTIDSCSLHTDKGVCLFPIASSLWLAEVLGDWRVRRGDRAILVGVRWVFGAIV